MVRFEIEHLRDDQLVEAWPVVRMSAVHARPDWWVSEAAALIERGGGILAARALDSTIHGIATYEIASRAHLGRILAVDTLITFELSRRAPTRHALYAALELLAGAFDCRSIILPLPSKGHVHHRVKALFGHLDFEASPDTA